MAEGANIGPVILKANWTEASLAIVTVALRMYTRVFVTRRVGWDDYCMLLALALGLINTSLMTVSEHYGLGQHFNALSPENQVNAMKYDFYLQPFSIMSPAVGRISYALLLMQIVPQYQKRRRWLLATIVALQLVVNILCFVFIVAQCNPTAAFYDPSVPGTCWSKLFQQYYGYFQGSWNSATDLALALFPATLFWNLQMKTSHKVGLIILMGLGVLAMFASCIRTWGLFSVGSADDYTYTTAQLSIWYTLEMYLVIIVASIPTLKPLLSWKKPNSSSKESYELHSDRSRRRQGYLMQPELFKTRNPNRFENLPDVSKETEESSISEGPIPNCENEVRKTTKFSAYHEPFESANEFLPTAYDEDAVTVHRIV